MYVRSGHHPSSDAAMGGGKVTQNQPFVSIQVLYLNEEIRLLTTDVRPLSDTDVFGCH